MELHLVLNIYHFWVGFEPISRDINANQTDGKKNEMPNFESLAVDDGKEGGKDVDGNKNVNKELPKWIRVVSPS